MAQFEQETSYDSSEPNSITNSSTQEGEHTIHGEEDEEDENEEIGEIAVDEVVEKLQVGNKRISESFFRDSDFYTENA